MTMNDDAGFTSREKRGAARYVWEISLGLLLFITLFIGLPNWWHVEPGTWQHTIQVLLPVLPLVWVPIAVWRHFRRMDELQRAVFARSLGFGFAIAMLIAVIIGMLRGRGVEVPAAEWIIFILGMSGWGVALPVNFAKSNR